MRSYVRYTAAFGIGVLLHWARWSSGYPLETDAKSTALSNAAVGAKISKSYFNTSRPARALQEDGAPGATRIDSPPPVEDPGKGVERTCEWARNESQLSFIPYHVIAYCYAPSPKVAACFLFPLVVLFFYFGGFISEYYFTPPIVHFASLLGLSDSLAGCTLLAFANSSGDLLSGITGAATGPEALNLFVGDVFGASLFLTTAVLGGALYASPGPWVHMDRRIVFRDTAFYVIGLVVFLVLGTLGTMPAWIPLPLFLLYCCYVTLAVWQSSEKPSTAVHEVLKRLRSAEDHMNKTGFESGEGYGFIDSEGHSDADGGVPRLCVSTVPTPSLDRTRASLSNAPSALNSQKTDETTRLLPTSEAVSPLYFFGSDEKLKAVAQNSNTQEPTDSTPVASRYVYDLTCPSSEPVLCEPERDPVVDLERAAGSTEAERQATLPLAGGAVRFSYDEIAAMVGAQRPASMMLSTRAGKRLLSQIQAHPVETRASLLGNVMRYPIESLEAVRNDSAILTPESATAVKEKVGPSLRSQKLRHLLPLIFIWNLTIPRIGPQVSPIWFLVYPFSILGFLYWNHLEFFAGIAFYWVLLLATALSAITFLVRSRREGGIWGKPVPTHVLSAGFLRTGLAAIMALYWNGLIVTEAIQCLMTVGSILGIPSGILGLTVVAWGNCAPDFFANISVAATGYTSMALGGVYGSSIMLLLFGTSLTAALSGFRTYMKTSVLSATPLVVDRPMLACISTQLLVTSMWTVFLASKDCRVPSKSGVSLVVAFLAAVLLVLYVAIRWSAT